MFSTRGRGLTLTFAPDDGMPFLKDAYGEMQPMPVAKFSKDGTFNAPNDVWAKALRKHKSNRANKGQGEPLFEEVPKDVIRQVVKLDEVVRKSEMPGEEATKTDKLLLTLLDSIATSKKFLPAQAPKALELWAQAVERYNPPLARLTAPVKDDQPSTVRVRITDLVAQLKADGVYAALESDSAGG